MSSLGRQWIATTGWLAVCGALLAVLLLTETTSLHHKGLTTDEPLHYEYGYRVLNGAPERTSALNSSTMPFSSVHAMTSINLAVFARTAGLPLDTSWTGQITRGRYATIALSLLLALYVLKWSYELYGRNGALLSLSLYVFDAVSVVTINLGFCFSGIGTPLSEYTLKDPIFKKLQATPIVCNLPLPLPVPYVQGLDLVKFEERMGEAWGNIYMAGHLRVNHH